MVILVWHPVLNITLWALLIRHLQGKFERVILALLVFNLHGELSWEIAMFVQTGKAESSWCKHISSKKFTFCKCEVCCEALDICIFGAFTEMVLAYHNMTYSRKVSNKGAGKEWPSYAHLSLMWNFLKWYSRSFGSLCSMLGFIIFEHLQSQKRPCESAIQNSGALSQAFQISKDWKCWTDYPIMDFYLAVVPIWC